MRLGRDYQSEFTRMTLVALWHIILQKNHVNIRTKFNILNNFETTTMTGTPEAPTLIMPRTRKQGRMSLCDINMLLC